MDLRGDTLRLIRFCAMQAVPRVLEAQPGFSVMRTYTVRCRVLLKPEPAQLYQTQLTCPLVRTSTLKVTCRKFIRS